jgi:hypothetical protein
MEIYRFDFNGTFVPAFFCIARQKLDSSVSSILNSTPLNTLVLGALFFEYNFSRQMWGVLIGL